MKKTVTDFLKALGPGLMFASTSIGASHVVQSTRAGAEYGLALIVIIVLAGLLKYPAFRVGPHYAIATGESLLTAYRRQGKIVLGIFIFITVSCIVALQAAVTITAAALLENLLHLPTNLLLSSAVLTFACILIIGIGKFHFLDIINKILLLLMTATTIYVSVLIWKDIPWHTFTIVPDFASFDARDLIFMATLIGWMPTAIDVAVLSSMWTLAKEKDTHYRPSLRQSILDFDFGYIGTIVLAFFFVFLGAGAMYNGQVHFSDNSAKFVEQFINLYTMQLGEWTTPYIDFCAFAVMFSTMLMIIDGFPRILRGILVIPFVPLNNDKLLKLSEHTPMEGKQYYYIAAGIAVASLAFLAFMPKSLVFMVDFATGLSFVTAPLLAWFNYRAIQSSRIPAHMRPSRGFMVYSGVCVVLLTVLALYYLWIRLV